MDTQKLEKAVRMGLLMAAGQPIDDAVKCVMGCLELVLDHAPAMPARSAPPPAPVFADDVPVEALPPHPITGTPIEDLAPIRGGTAPGASNKTRTYWGVEDLQNLILANTPTQMTIKVSDNGDEITIYRKLNQQSGACPGIQLGYGPQVPDPRVPFPKVSFWTTTEAVDIPNAIKEIEAAAISMYRMRAMPATKIVAAKPLRFAVGGEVE
jgi:hypothetical protein